MSELYNVSHGGIAGGLGRVVVYANYPVSLVAIALVLIAVDVLPRAAWWAAGPAIALCALTASTVDPGDLDVRWINVFPAVGVADRDRARPDAAVRRAGTSFVSRRRGDPLRIVVTAVVLVLSIPWFAADPRLLRTGTRVLHEADRDGGDGDAPRSAPRLRTTVSTAPSCS